MYVTPPPPEPQPNGFIDLEMAIKRDHTAWFIAANPIDLALTPTSKQRQFNGSSQVMNLPARPTQRFRLISMSASQKPKITDDGVEREIDLTLLGMWDAQVHIGDWWRDAEDLFYEVIEMVPNNGYEIRALVIKKGHG